jgi:prefoldin subunit 5
VQAVSPSVEDRFRKLEQRQEEMERELREKDERIRQLERQLGTRATRRFPGTP